jgi:hypothetical protein
MATCGVDEDVRVVPKEAKGKEDSLKTTCCETHMWFMERPRHQYPLCLDE